jgi:tRNA(adenine34) deaminase
MFDEKQIRTYLETALDAAERTFKLGNYPIAVVVVGDHGKQEFVETNQCASLDDLTAHAEILAIRKLSNRVIYNTPDKSFYMFSTLEPCYGCSFFLARTNIKHIYSALKDPHKGGISDLKNKEQFYGFFNNTQIINEPFEDLKERSKKLMQDYFLSNNQKYKATYYGYNEK